MKRFLVSAAALLALAPSAWATDALPTAKPEQVGLSAERLARIDRAMEGHVDQGHFSGAIGMIVRRGKVGYFKTWGDLDRESGTRMSEDAIFRMYSMTKAVTGVAAMILYEHGHFALTDPISNYLPEFKTMQVCGRQGWPGDRWPRLLHRARRASDHGPRPVHAHSRAELPGSQGAGRGKVLRQDRCQPGHDSRRDGQAHRKGSPSPAAGNDLAIRGTRPMCLRGTSKRSPGCRSMSSFARTFSSRSG